MAIAFQQKTSIAAVASPAALPSLTLAAGEDGLVLIVSGTTVSPGNSVADNNSGVWTHVTGFPLTAGSGASAKYVDIWFSIGHPSGATIVTVTSAATVTAVLSTYSGVATASAVDTQNSSNNGLVTTTSPQTGLVSTTNGNDVLVGGVMDRAGISGGTSPTDYGTGGGTPTNLIVVSTNQLDTAYQIVSATGSYGFQWTYGTAELCLGGIIALKAAATAGGITRRLIRRFASVTRAMHVMRPIVRDSPLRRAMIANAFVSPANAFPQPRKLRRPPRAITRPGPRGLRGRAPEIRAVKANAFVSPANAAPPPRKLRHLAKLTRAARVVMAPKRKIAEPIGAEQFAIAPRRKRAAISRRTMKRAATSRRRTVLFSPPPAAAPSGIPTRLLRKANVTFASNVGRKTRARVARSSAGRRIAKIAGGAEQFAIAPRRKRAAISRRTTKRAATSRRRTVLFSPPPAAAPSGIPTRLLRKANVTFASNVGRKTRACVARSAAKRAVLANAHVSPANAFPFPRKLRRPARSSTWPRPKGLRGRAPETRAVKANAHVSPANASPPPKKSRHAAKVTRAARVAVAPKRRIAELVGAEQFAIAPRRKRSVTLASNVGRKTRARVARSRARRVATLAAPATMSPGMPPKIIRRRSGTPAQPARRIPSARSGRRAIGGATRPLFAPRIVFNAKVDRTMVFGNCALDPAMRFNAALNPPLVFNQVMLDPAIRFGAALDPTIVFGATLD